MPLGEQKGSLDEQNRSLDEPKMSLGEQKRSVDGLKMSLDEPKRPFGEQRMSLSEAMSGQEHSRTGKARLLWQSQLAGTLELIPDWQSQLSGGKASVLVRAGASARPRRAPPRRADLAGGARSPSRGGHPSRRGPGAPVSNAR